ncbi:acetyltransferase, ribosomal protein N-acetylase [Rheinheimera sp. A13L]|uniref:GNAT family N-acetyltransferase n=1 Tax=Rheinheimera sp. A13L TaxID=506534 RepID=UPI0002124D1C|nr:GNAT family protein [Rheinheimera sp. A13L]EGM79059.1 acetyltransferase, ribosomal protein N-acetylase [Rheinheimera sp. A13L]
MVFPSLETERLVLTELSVDDEADLFNLFSNPSVVEYYDLDAFSEYSQAANLISLFKSRYEEKQGIRWAIRLKASGQLIGTCGFNSWSSKMRHAVIGYDLLPEFWRQGYTLEAVRAIIAAGFAGSLVCGELHRIQADTVPGNSASESLLRRLGFKEEGLRRECGYWKNKFHDLKCFGLLRSEFIEI